jgi:hypothetical protein
VSGETVEGLTAQEWADTARQAIERNSAAERLTGLTHAEHVLRALPEIRDRLLGPARPLTREHVIAVLDEMQAEMTAAPLARSPGRV